MRIPFFTKQFRKDFKRLQKSGKSIVLLKAVMQDLIEGKTLNPTFHNHKLSGEWEGCYDCHIQGDFLLLYKLIGKTEIQFLRTGNHADLFG